MTDPFYFDDNNYNVFINLFLEKIKLNLVALNKYLNNFLKLVKKCL
jgi:hypothetical protein